MEIQDVLVVALLAFFGSRLLISAGRSLQGPARRHARMLIGGLRWRHFAPIPVVIPVVLATALLLLEVPGLSFGWWVALGGEGNPVFGVTETTAGTPFELLIPVVFIGLLLPALPLLVEGEERMFRLGAESWSGWKRLWKGLLFGLVHAAIGIPIAVALALSIGGWYFTAAYLRGWRVGHSRSAALLESTRAHLAYNLTVIAIVTAFLVLLIALHLAP